ncbi:hypothetical protein B0J12DRAFT_715563 [Macrophomina phaseolina]|uniref:Uncharacterized protein n=1 Tax=Macrophomina phaseolina TaxID=35725 RepID=A0ABQ8GVZ7_9PEZI|nr:hypothetical protein B0J12DRAFT_715563 [Macrophomina phaseolina]
MWDSARMAGYRTDSWLKAVDNGYSANYFKNVLPVPCRCHNDYWRTAPPFAALGSGCELYVGHTGLDLTEENTLSNLYIDPLKLILHDMNTGNTTITTKTSGFFYISPSQALTLVIDFKAAGEETLATPLTIVASSNAPSHGLTANATYHDIFFDTPLAALADPSDSPTAFVSSDGKYMPEYNPFNSHLASVHALQGQILAAKQRGLVPRYWGTPRWPRSLRDEIQAMLVREETGSLSVDDLRAVRKGNWGLWPQVVTVRS